MGFTIQFHVHSISPEPFERFSLNFSLKCSSQWDGVQNPWLSYADSRSRSHFKVMGFTLQLYVRSISPESFERFSLNFKQDVAYDSTTLTQPFCGVFFAVLQSTFLYTFMKITTFMLIWVEYENLLWVMRAYSVTEISLNVEILHVSSLHIILSRELITVALIRLCRCPDWSVPLLLVSNKIRFWVMRFK